MLHIARKPENDPSSFDHVDKSVYICIYLQTPKMITKLKRVQICFSNDIFCVNCIDRKKDKYIYNFI